MYDLAATLAFEAASAPGEAARQSVAAYQAIRPQPFPSAAVETILLAFDRQSRA